MEWFFERGGLGVMVGGGGLIELLMNSDSGDGVE